MKTLMLIRHAKSDWNTIGQKDVDRRLNQRGEYDAPIMGKRLAARLQAAGQSLDAFSSSSACRAKQTALLLAAELGWDAESISWQDRLYLASPATLLDQIHAFPDDAQTAIVLAHNPGISELAEQLSGQWIGNVPSCSILTFHIPVVSWRDVSIKRGLRQAELVDFDCPKSLNA